MNEHERQERANEPKDVALERHYSVQEIADLWHFEYNKIRRLFDSEPGVLKEVWNGTLAKRRYTSLRIPESVVIRVHRRLRAGGTRDA